MFYEFFWSWWGPREWKHFWKLSYVQFIFIILLHVDISVGTTILRSRFTLCCTKIIVHNNWGIKIFDMSKFIILNYN